MREHGQQTYFGALDLTVEKKTPLKKVAKYTKLMQMGNTKKPH
jgi:hypothetical protein